MPIDIEEDIRVYTEYPWWLIVDLPSCVICGSKEDPLLGFLKVCVTKHSLKGWKAVNLVDIRAMRVVDTGFLLKAGIKGVYLQENGEGTLSIEGDKPSKFVISEFINSWSSSGDLYEKYIADLINLKTLCVELHRVVTKMERLVSVVSKCNNLKELLSKYEGELEVMIGNYPQEYISKWGSPVDIRTLIEVKGS